MLSALLAKYRVNYQIKCCHKHLSLFEPFRSSVAVKVCRAKRVLNNLQHVARIVAAHLQRAIMHN